MIQSEKLLTISKKLYTLTVITNPVEATCTLTYNGVAHSGKSASVKEGTVISYSIYHATYGTTTGSIIMNTNKTLTCTGAQSTGETEIPWEQPTLTSNTGNSQLKVSSTTIASTSQEPWTLFDNDVSSNNYWQGKNNIWPATISITTADAIKISSIKFMNGAANYPRSGYISCNGTNIKSFTSSAGNKEDWTISVNSNTYSTSHTINFQSGSSSAYGPRLKKVYITATEMSSGQTWTRPNLTANGTLGVSDYATYASSVYSTYDAYKAVDGNSSTYWRGTATAPYYWTFYAKDPIKVTGMSLTAQASGQSGYYQAQEFQIRGSNDNLNWTTLHTKTGTTMPQVYTATLSPTAYYNYYQVYITKPAIGTTTIYNEIQFTATQKISSYNYYWNKTIS